MARAANPLIFGGGRRVDPSFTADNPFGGDILGDAYKSIDSYLQNKTPADGLTTFFSPGLWGKKSVSQDTWNAATGARDTLKDWYGKGGVMGDEDISRVGDALKSMSDLTGDSTYNDYTRKLQKKWADTYAVEQAKPTPEEAAQKTAPINTPDAGALTESAPEIDFNGITGSITDLIKGAMSDPLDRARQIGTYFNGIDFDRQMADAMGRINSASDARLHTAQEQTISRELARGKSLEEVQGDLDLMGYKESQNRELATNSAASSVEQMENQVNMARANAMASGDMAAVQQSAQLASQLGGLLGSMAGTEANYNLGVGGLDLNRAKLMADTTMADRQFEEGDQNQIISLINAMNGQNLAMSQGETNSWLSGLLNTVGNMASFRAGNPINQYSIGTAFNTVANNMLQRDIASKQAEASQQSGGFLGIPGFFGINF